jgi:hypothetical protein
MLRKKRTLRAKQIRSLPPLPCPSCGVNILQGGFHNACTELIAVREDNYPVILDGCIYLEHVQKNQARVSHDCGTYVYCSNCNKPLPWPLRRIRDLSGVTLTRIAKAIITLIEDSQGGPPQA